ncbi:MAG: sulfatase [Candidatus Cryptobacteroides sp.]
MKYLRLAGLLALVPAGCAHEDEGSSRPNIIFIMSDDHAYQALSAYGHPISACAPTPNIDRIAKNGMIFRNAFVENSISAPSRATLLTGMYSGRHGQTTLQYGIMDTTITQFPELLQEAGYRTALFGKWHLSIEPVGFDYFDIFRDQGEYFNPDMRTSETGGEFIRQEGYATELVTEHALNWLKNNKDCDKPFCLMIHHKAPHRNWMPAPQDMTLYEDIRFPEPETLFEDYSGSGDQMRQQQLTVANDLGYAFDFKVQELKDVPTHQYIKDSWDIAMSRLTPGQRAHWDSTYAQLNKSFLSNPPEGRELVRWKYQRYIHDYCRTVHGVDTSVGEVLDYLEKNGLSGNTIVIYTSDQGFYLGEHGLYDKRFMYEEALRTPLLISWPGHIQPGSECMEMVQNIDYAPTILDVAGATVPDNMDGVSLTPLFDDGREEGWRDAIYYRYYDCPAVGNVRKHYGIRTGKYKLIHWYDSASEYSPAIDSWEMFDLQADPSETDNIFCNPELADVRDSLIQRLEAHQ